jgi:hypothetical protein
MEIKHIIFTSEAYMPQTYFQMVKAEKDGVIAIRLSDRKDSSLFNIQRGESIVYQTDTGEAPKE